MNIAMLIIGIIRLVVALFLIVAVLMQQGKAHNLSGAIAGGAETFFGKSKAQTMNKKLSVLTTVVAIVFALLVCAVYVIQPNSKSADDYGSFWEMLFDNGETEDLGASDDKEEVEHDHDGDGKPDHDAHEHEDEAEGDKADDTTAAKDDKAEDTTAADTTAAE